MSESEVKLKSEFEQDYDKLIEIYPTLSVNSQSISSTMFTVVEKCEKVIQKHPRSKWRDDCNLLIGKAYFYQEDYESAIKNLLYITSDYIQAKENPVRKKKKKKKRKKRGRGKKKKGQKKDEFSVEALLDKYKISHQPAYFEAINWMILAYAKSGDLDNAMIIADLVLSDIDIEDRDKQKIALTQAHLYIQQENYFKALLPLKKAIALTQKKKDKAKYTFLLGQLLLRQEKTQQAIEEFENVIALKTDYDLDFNAKLKIASTFQQMASGTNANIKKLVKDMIADENNFDQLDKLYYSLGKIALAEDDIDAALRHFDKSIEQDSENKVQEGKSYLAKGEIFAYQGLYIPASIMYDSAVVRLNKDMDNFMEISSMQGNLRGIKINKEEVILQDSVQQLVDWDKEAIDDLINDLIEKKKAEIAAEEQRLLEELEAKKNKDAENTTTTSGFGRKQSWYFYNQNTRKIGLQTFQRKWGSRTLEDFWRRKNKGSNSDEEDMEEEDDEVTEADYLDPQFYWKNIPKTEEKMQNSNDRIASALFNLGIIFKDKMEDFDKSSFYFEELLKRFPNLLEKEKILYYLHINYTKAENTGKAQFYLNKLLKEYPNGAIAKSTQPKNEKSDNYKNMFDLYDAKNYEQCIVSIDKNFGLLPNEDLKANALFLKANSYGFLNEQDSLAHYLQIIIKNYTESTIRPSAERILAYWEESGTQNVSLFLFRPEALHFLIVLMDPVAYNTSNITVDLADFNNNIFKKSGYELTNSALDAKNRMIVVKRFKNKQEGEEYLTALKKNKKMTDKLAGIKHNLFLISKNNYGKLHQGKNVEKYLKFYQKNYSN